MTCLHRQEQTMHTVPQAPETEISRTYVDTRASTTSGESSILCPRAIAGETDQRYLVILLAHVLLLVTSRPHQMRLPRGAPPSTGTLKSAHSAIGLAPARTAHPKSVLPQLMRMMSVSGIPRRPNLGTTAAPMPWWTITSRRTETVCTNPFPQLHVDSN